MKMKGLVIIFLILFTIVNVSAHSQVEFVLKAGGSAQDLNVYVKNNLNTSVPPFDSRFMYTDDISGQNEGWHLVKVQPMGISFPEPIQVGEFTACVRNGNGGQPECQVFTIKEDEHKRVVFLGHAVSCSGIEENVTPKDEVCIPVYVHAIGTDGNYFPPHGFTGIFTNENKETTTVTFKYTYYYLLEPRCVFPQPIYKTEYYFSYQVPGNSDMISMYQEVPRPEGNGLFWMLQLISKGCEV